MTHGWTNVKISGFIFGCILIASSINPPTGLSNEIDSLQELLSTAKGDTSEIKLLFQLSSLARFSTPDSAVQYCRSGIELSQKLGEQLFEAIGYNLLGITYYYQGKYDSSLHQYYSSLNLLEKLQANNDTSISRKVRIEIADNLHDIGKVFYRQTQYEKALEYYHRSLKIHERLNNKTGMSSCYNNIGGIYYQKNNPEKTLVYLNKSLSIEREMNHPQNIATRLENIAIIYRKLGKKDKALTYLLEALHTREHIGDLKGLAYSYGDLGGFYYDIKNYPEALNYLHKSLEMAQRINVKERIKAAYESLSSVHEAMGNHLQALEYFRLSSQIKDSLLNESTARQIADMETKYETEKKEKENELLRNEKALQSSEIRRQRTVIVFIFTALALLSLLAFYIYRSYLQKKKANAELHRKNLTITRQKTEIEQQKSVIEEKNRNITDSIYYAQRIQQAILPTIETIRKFIPEIFILYKPKDIVCGDFYWVASPPSFPPVGGSGTSPSPMGKVGMGASPPPAGEAGRGAVLLACCDCTGHGVPGALISMTGNDLLNEIIAENKNLSPAEILTTLDVRLTAVLNPQGRTSDVQDGMDIAILKIIHNVEAHRNASLYYAGANRSLIHVRHGNLTEYKHDNHSIGGYFTKQKSFTLHEVPVSPGDMVYLFTDGYPDQIGGPHEKKFMSKNFKELLVKVANKSLPEQEQILDETFEQWKGVGEQMDDVTVVGMRF